MASSAGEYIAHHLTSWCVGCGADGQPSGLVDLGAFSLDMILIGLVCAGLIGLLALFVRKHLTAEDPGRLQAALEAGVDYINGQISQSFHKRNEFVGSLALTIFLWISVMNMADLLPLDLVPGIVTKTVELLGADEAYFRIVPTAALDTPFAMALVVFVLMFVFHLKSRGLFGFIKHYWTEPYGKYVGPANLVSNLIEDLAKPVSLSLRLFGTMFAGELIFALLALLTMSALEPLKASIVIWAPLQFIGGFAWSVFHVLVVFLQAFIFAILTIVYLGMTQEAKE